MIVITGIYQEIVDSIIDLDENKTESLVKTAIESDYAPMLILKAALVPGVDALTEKFRTNEFFIPELLCGVKAFQKGLDIIKPLIAAEEGFSLGVVVLGTVQGDIHDLGKNIVGVMLEATGFEVVDLGTDVSAETFADAVKKYKPKIVGLSALLTTTMTYMAEIINKLAECGLRNSVKVMVGGAVINQAFADRIRADGYAKDAPAAVVLAKSLLKLEVGPI